MRRHRAKKASLICYLTSNYFLFQTNLRNFYLKGFIFQDYVKWPTPRKLLPLGVKVVVSTDTYLIIPVLMVHFWNPYHFLPIYLTAFSETLKPDGSDVSFFRKQATLNSCLPISFPYNNPPLYPSLYFWLFFVWRWIVIFASEFDNQEKNEKETDCFKRDSTNRLFTPW